MPRLILLNGPPACGKSTLARMYVEEHPLALALDVDQVRGMLGRWRDTPLPAGLAARAIALAAARVHLAAGHDVVVPQLLAEPTFRDQLHDLAGELDATFHEVVLMDGRENSQRRYAEREGEGYDPHLYDRLVEFVAARSATRVVPVVDGRVEETYRAVFSTCS